MRKRVRSIVFQTIALHDSKLGKQAFFHMVGDFKFNEELGFGLSAQESTDDSLLIKVVKRTATFINDYNGGTNEFIRKQIFIYSDFEFCIDFKINIIYVFGGISQINYMKYVLRNLLKSGFTLTPAEVDPYFFYQILSDKKVDAKIEHITVNHFNFQNELVGRFSGDVLNQSVVATLLETYKTDIVKVSFLIRVSQNEEFILHALPNGALKFLSDAGDVEFLTDYLKNIIFSNHG